MNWITYWIPCFAGVALASSAPRIASVDRPTPEKAAATVDAGSGLAVDLSSFSTDEKLVDLDIPKFSPDDRDGNFSGIAFNPATNTLLVVDNEPNAGNSKEKPDQGELYEFDLGGKFRRRVDLEGFSDPEGIALVGADPKREGIDRYVLCEERIGRLVVISLDRSKEDARISREDCTVIEPRPNPIDDGDREANNGFEGVAYDPAADVYYFAKEHGPKRGIYRVKPDGVCDHVRIDGLYDGIPGKSEAIEDLADIQFRDGHLYILGEITNRIVAVKLMQDAERPNAFAGEVVGQFPPLGALLPHRQPEGIALSNDGRTLWVVGEPREFAAYRVRPKQGSRDGEETK